MADGEMLERLGRIEQAQAAIVRLLGDMVAQKIVKDAYSVDEVAERVERTTWQVREWLREGRMIGVKRATGRGRHKEWQVSHEELAHYQSHGLRPAARRSPA
jgi:predicted transcriptional regulator